MAGTNVPVRPGTNIPAGTNVPVGKLALFKNTYICICRAHKHAPTGPTDKQTRSNRQGDTGLVDRRRQGKQTGRDRASKQLKTGRTDMYRHGQLTDEDRANRQEETGLANRQRQGIQRDRAHG